MKVFLVIVDPNNDFVCKREMVKYNHPQHGVIEVPTGNEGSLYVAGAEQNADNLVAMLDARGDKFDDIFVTLDAHHDMDQAHVTWWKDKETGALVDPFTCIGIHPDRRRVVQFLLDAAGAHPTERELTTTIPSYMYQGGVTSKGSFGYLEVLEARGRYRHFAWPVHCRIGQWGGAMYAPLGKALSRWAVRNLAVVNYVTKGSNIYTEHYSAVEAEVPDPQDESTQVHRRLVQALEVADIIAFGGWARSHCVAETFRSIAKLFSNPKYIEKLVMLEDATADVTGLEFMGEAFVKEMVAKGMKISNTRDFLA